MQECFFLCSRSFSFCSSVSLAFLVFLFVEPTLRDALPGLLFKTCFVADFLFTVLATRFEDAFPSDLLGVVCRREDFAFAFGLLFLRGLEDDAFTSARPLPSVLISTFVFTGCLGSPIYEV